MTASGWQGPRADTPISGPLEGFRRYLLAKDDCPVLRHELRVIRRDPRGNPVHVITPAKILPLGFAENCYWWHAWGGRRR